MNKERMQTLREAIAAALPDEFEYSSFFCKKTGLGGIRQLSMQMTVPEPHCGTVGCVAGWALMLFSPGIKTYPLHCSSRIDAGDIPMTTSKQAQELLDLTSKERDFLFVDYVMHATREDALRRLDFLIADGYPDAYDWTKESWFAEHFEDEGFNEDGSICDDPDEDDDE